MHSSVLGCCVSCACCAAQFIYKSSHGGVNVMDPARPEIQECFTRAGAEMDAWKYTWRVSAPSGLEAVVLRCGQRWTCKHTQPTAGCRTVTR